MPDPWEPSAETPERAREKLPESLRDIPLSDVEAVASLPMIYLKPLADAYIMEKFDIPRAVEYIKTSNNVFITPEEICEAARSSSTSGRIEAERDAVPVSLPTPPSAPAEKTEETKPAAPVAASTPPPALPPTREDLDHLARMLMLCFRDMPKITAESMAESDLLREVLAVVSAKRLAVGSKYAASEFVLLTLLFLFHQSEKEIRDSINQKPSLKKLLEEKGYPQD
jgi:hypothetical protein